LGAEVVQLAHGSRIDETPIALGQHASMRFLYASGTAHSSANENSLVVRLDLGTTRVLLVGDAEQVVANRRPRRLQPNRLKACS
jgi:beta-lactamase superfamily II metal-dependent hydrolase